MHAILTAKVGSLGAAYVDGTPNLEIRMVAHDADGLAFVTAERTPITLRIAGHDYTGAVLANKPHHDTVWISPTVFGAGGERLTLGRVLTDAGFRANDAVRLVVHGTVIEVQGEQ